jgi:hypothetical protein
MCHVCSLHAAPVVCTPATGPCNLPESDWICSPAGEWLNGLQHGEGVCEYSGGLRYEGSWRKGVRHGRGTLSAQVPRCLMVCIDLAQVVSACTGFHAELQNRRSSIHRKVPVLVREVAAADPRDNFSKSFLLACCRPV